MKEKEELTILDLFKLEGATGVLTRYAQHLSKNVLSATINYESTDFDRATFLADVAYALDNVNVVTQAAMVIKETLMTMRAEVSENFDNQDVESL